MDAWFPIATATCQQFHSYSDHIKSSIVNRYHLYVTVLIPRPCPGNEASKFVVPIEALASGTKMESSDQCRADQRIR